jgi:hypothetical protein
LYLKLAILFILAACNGLLSILTLHKVISRSWLRHYYLLALLLVLNLLAAVLPVASIVAAGKMWTHPNARNLFWTFLFLYELVMYCLVLQMAYRVGKEIPDARRLVRALPVAAAAILAATILFHHHNRIYTFLSYVTRDLTFAVALMNMLLWRFLLQVKKRDFLRLTVSAGLGIQCTGDAIGHSIRHFSSQGLDVGDVVLSLCGLLTIGIWYLGFSKGERALNAGASRTPVDRAPAEESAVPPENVLHSHRA